MKRILALILALLALGAWPVLGEEAEPPVNLDVTFLEDCLLSDPTWIYTGYTYGGITFAVPSNSEMYPISFLDKLRGLVQLVGNRDYMLQLRAVNDSTLEEFQETVEKEPTSQSWTETHLGTECLIYRNTAPAHSGVELFGIAMTGIDGKLYKISIFTGESEAYGSQDPVWAIAEIIAKTARVQDFSEWGIEME